MQRWRVSWIRCIPYWWYSPPRREDNTSYWISDGLGVTIDGKFAFYEHISGVCRKASSRAGVGRCATLLRTVPTIVTAHAKVVARGAKEMRNTQDTRTGFVSSNCGRFLLFLVEKMRRFPTDEKNFLFTLSVLWKPQKYVHVAISAVWWIWPNIL